MQNEQAESKGGKKKKQQKKKQQRSVQCVHVAEQRGEKLDSAGKWKKGVEGKVEGIKKSRPLHVNLS